MGSHSQTIPIPEPRGLPYLGHVAEFKSEDSLKDIDRLHNTYGDIFRLRFPTVSYVFVGTQKLVNEIFDEKRFYKSVQGELTEARVLVGDGLFTAKTEEENWGLAHRILMPAFGPVSIRGMFDDMYGIAMQMALKWARFGPSHSIAASEDFTRLALDTLALCSMGYRFNSFYREGLHPFVQSMGDSLVEVGKRSQRPEWADLFYRSSKRKLQRDAEVMRNTSLQVLEARRSDTTRRPKKDLLDAMMEGIDPRTGAKLSDDNIINNLITFLIAGHETTSGTLSFAFYSMLKNPHTYLKAQKEVDEIMGQEPITVDKIFKLKYIPAVLRETLRQCSPIPGVTVEPYEDTLLDNKYPVKKGEPVAAMFSRSHVDPAVFGENARDFEPERMLDDNFNRLQKDFPNCWKPFGNGLRACIGRPFAWQEMLLTMSLLLQNFDFQMDDPLYNLKIVETLTVKPKDFYMRATLRRESLILENTANGKAPEAQVNGRSNGNSSTPKTSASSDAKSLTVLYGSNSGTCEALARRLAADAGSHGFKISKVDTLDSAKDRLPKDQPVLIFVPSYEGQPPDNARHFVTWLESLSGNELDGVSFAVFGAGNAEWSQTFHRVPKLINTRLSKHGACQLVDMGLTDAAEKDPFADFETWEDDQLWPALERRYSISTADKEDAHTNLNVDVSTPRSSTLRQQVQLGIVTEAKELSTSAAVEKRHLEVKLPAGKTYEAGDYLAVLPMNPSETVNRVFRRFKLPLDAVLVIDGGENTLLPLHTPTSALDVLSSYVELSQPATRKDIHSLSKHAPDEALREQIIELSESDKLRDEITKRRVSVLDLLERFPSLEISIGTFLSMLSPMRIRQYSISSSPLHDPNHATITYSVLAQPSFSGQGRHMGVAANYLASLKPEDRLHVAVRQSHLAFHLPRTPETTPIICIAAGTGLAPFRGFMQERALQTKAGRTLAPALLFYGCRDQSDDLYREEFAAWEQCGAVSVRRAYSRQTSEESAGCKYVQDRMLKDKEILCELWKKGAKLFFCGSRAIGDAVEGACVDILSELNGTNKEEAKALLKEVRNDRFAVDVFD